MKKNMILISGPQGSGKSSLSSGLARVLKQREIIKWPIPCKFAEPLYTMHEYLLNFMATKTGNPRIDKDGPLLQMLGTDWGRNRYGENVWVDIAKKKSEELIASGYFPIYDDCRFENEFDAFPNALRIRIECPENIRRQRIESQEGQSWRNPYHPSEQGLNSYSNQGLFDLYVNSSMHTKEEIVELVINKWKESING